MAFYKVIASGNILEVYEYEKEPVAPCMFDFENDKHNKYEKIVLGNDDKNWVHEKVDRASERRKQTLRDARNTSRRLALMNFRGSCSFVTLTYAEHVTDIVEADKHFKAFIRKVRKHYGKKFKYLAVREFTKIGRIHFHLLIDFEVPDDKTEEEIKALECYWHKSFWRHGWVDIKRLNHVDNVGAYLVKYMTKEISIEAFKGHKVYLCSKGLERPIELKGEEAEAIINVYQLKQKNPVYANSYISEYLGEIKYQEFNLLR